MPSSEEANKVATTYSAFKFSGERSRKKNIAGTTREPTTIPCTQLLSGLNQIFLIISTIIVGGSPKNPRLLRFAKHCGQGT